MLGQLATEVQTKLHTLVTLTRAGIVHPERPDRLWHTARALLRYGTTPAAGYTAAARSFADEPAIIDELGTLTFRDVDERTNALAHALAGDGIGEGALAVLLKQLGPDLSPMQTTQYRANVVEANRKAALLYPTNATLRARLAESSADIGMTPDALKEGKAALELDARTPHADKKLDPEVRAWLQEKIPEWEKAVAQAEEIARPKGKPKPPTNP